MAPFVQSVDTPTPNIAVSRVAVRVTNQEPKVNDANTTFAIMSQLHVKSRTTTTAPGSPAEGDAYIVPSGSSGYTGCSTGDVAFYSNGWGRQTPPAAPGAWYAYVEDEAIQVRSTSPTTWVENAEAGSVSAGLTASTTQAQGQGAMTKVINQVSVCANANDVRTLPPARVGLKCLVANDGAQTLQVYPASGDKIDAGATDASTTIASGKRRDFYALDATSWVSILGA